MPRMATASDDPRIVLVYKTGAWAGLRQIMGTVSQLKAEMNYDRLPNQVEDVDLHDHKGIVVRVKTSPRAVFYVESVTHQGGQKPTFDKAQQ